MCTYQTENLKVSASAKINGTWMKMTDAIVYFDHPVHYCAGHALLIDVLNPSEGPSARAALELSAESARSLAMAILRTLDTLPDLVSSDPKS
jgi:hypothetical protein